MYRNILVAIDPDGGQDQLAAVHTATRLAEDGMARITALTVIEHLPAAIGREKAEDIRVRIADAAMGRLRELVGHLSDVKTVIAHGAAAHEILGYAGDHDIDCIVVASHRPGVVDYLLGSTAARVVRHAKCSVHVLRQPAA